MMNNLPKKHAQCSFCGINTSVGGITIIMGPGVSICSNCVETCVRAAMPHIMLVRLSDFDQFLESLQGDERQWLRDAFGQFRKQMGYHGDWYQ